VIADLHHEIRFVLTGWEYFEPVGYINVTSCGDGRVSGLAGDNKAPCSGTQEILEDVSLNDHFKALS
jgi:hypothetical protein